MFVVQAGGASATLDAIDRLKAIPGCRFLGLPTLADSPYMEVRPVELPSRRATLWLPIKVYRQRQRGPKQVYAPDDLYTDLDRSRAAMDRWALGVIRAVIQPPRA